MGENYTTNFKEKTENGKHLISFTLLTFLITTSSAPKRTDKFVFKRVGGTLYQFQPQWKYIFFLMIGNSASFKERNTESFISFKFQRVNISVVVQQNILPYSFFE